MSEHSIYIHIDTFFTDIPQSSVCFSVDGESKNCSFLCLDAYNYLCPFFIYFISV